MSSRQSFLWLVVALTFASTVQAGREPPRAIDRCSAAVAAPLEDRFLIEAIALCTPGIHGAEPPPADPVKQLREALRADLEAGTSKETLESYRKNVERRAAALNRLTDLGRALILKEWQDRNQRDKEVGRVAHEILDQLATRFRAGAQEVLRQGDAPGRVAAATFLGEMLAKARTNGVRSVLVWRAFAELAPDLAQATADTELSVRKAAAVALSKLEGRLRPGGGLVAVEVAVPAYGKMLASRETASRRLAASALGELVRTLHESVLRGYRPERGEPPDKASTHEVLQLNEAVVTILARGVRDTDPEVRRLSLEALREVAAGLAELACTMNLSPAGRGVSCEGHAGRTKGAYRLEHPRCGPLSGPGVEGQP